MGFRFTPWSLMMMRVGVGVLVVGLVVEEESVHG